MRSPHFAVDGCGEVGRLTALQILRQFPESRLTVITDRPSAVRPWFDRFPEVDVSTSAPTQLPDVVAVCRSSRRHAATVRFWRTRGVPVVSTTDDVDTIAGLLGTPGGLVVMGAACSPGMSCLLAKHAMSWYDSVSEVHVARYGSTGPSCHAMRARMIRLDSHELRDGEWVVRGVGTGRELCLFPLPIGPVDCYRARGAEPLLLHHAFPEVRRITSRIAVGRWERAAVLSKLPAARRRDRRFAVSVEIRGLDNGIDTTTVLGIAANDASPVAVLVTELLDRVCAAAPGTLGDHAVGVAELSLTPKDLFASMSRQGLVIQRFSPQNLG